MVIFAYASIIYLKIVVRFYHCPKKLADKKSSGGSLYGACTHAAAAGSRG